MHLKGIREKLGWSFGEMAELLGIGKSTYQCYDDGTRKTPPDTLKLAQESLEKIQAHSAMLKERYKPGGEAEQEFKRQYPHGIISEASE